MLRFFHRLVCAGMVLASTVSAQSPRMAPGEPGLAFVTSVAGEVSLKRPDLETTEPELHASLALDPATLETGSGGHVFVALSNGVALGLGPNSLMRVETFKQARFSEDEESLFYEPSTSQTRLELDSGLLAVDCDHLSPLSELRLKLPFGEIRIHAARCVISVDEAGMTIHSIQGHLTFYHPESSRKEFFSSPRTIRVTRGGAEVRSAATPKDEPDAATRDRYAAAVEFAAGRVLFLAAPEDAPFPARPLLVVPSEYGERASPRPYEYKDPF